MIVAFTEINEKMKWFKHILTKNQGIQNSKNKYTEEKYTNNNNLQISFVNN